MGQVRLRYTGLTAYTASVVMMFTGLAFTLIITRRLTAEELGAWRYIGTLISYFATPVYLMGFWATRVTAQGKAVLGTTTTMAALFSALATLIFVALSGAFAASIDFPATVFLIAALEIPSIYIYTILESTASAIRPHLNYYASIIQEAVKLPIGVVLVLSLKLGLTGAVWAAVAGFASRAIAMGLFLRDIEWGRPNRSTALGILTRTWLPLYSSIPPSILALDTVIVAVIYRTAEPLGYAAAVYLLGSVVAMSGNLAAGLYPRMLRAPSEKDVETAIKLVFMIAAPSSIGALILAENLLNLLRPEYIGGSIVVPMVIIQTLFYIVGNIFDSVIIGEERADFDETAGFKKLLRSRLFLLPTMNYVYSAVYLSTLVATLYLASPTGPIQILYLWVAVNAASTAGFTVFKWRIARQRVKFSLPTASLIKYLAASLLMSIILLFTRPSGLPIEISSALPQTLVPVAIGAATYFAALYTVDGEFRAIVRTVLRRLRLR